MRIGARCQLYATTRVLWKSKEARYVLAFRTTMSPYSFPSQGRAHIPYARHSAGQTSRFRTCTTCTCAARVRPKNSAFALAATLVLAYSFSVSLVFEFVT